MPDTRYDIEYITKPDKAIAGIDKLEARLLKFDREVDKSIAKLKNFGTSTAGFAKAMQSIQQLIAQMTKLGAVAGTTQAGLNKVGTGNTAITSYNARLAKLEADLLKATANANALAAALANAGTGGNLPGGGGGAGGGKGAAGGAGGGQSFVGRVGLGIARHGAYALFRSGVQAAGQGAAERRDFFSNAADMANEYRKDLQEVSILNGDNSVTDKAIREDLAFQKATNLNADESRSLRLEFGGAVAPGKARGNITDAVATDLEKEAGRFGVRYGLDMSTTGRMAGLLGNYGKVPSAQAGLGQMAESAEYMNIYGLGSVKSMMGPMVGLEADMLDSEEGGRFASMESLSARFAATTFAARSPAMAATQIRQSNRLLRKAIGQYGITAEDDYETALGKISPFISGPQGDQVLIDAGFHNTTEVASVRKQAAMTKVVEAAKADPRMARAKAEAAARNEEFAGSIQGKQRAAENAEFASTVEAGLAGEALKAARVNARAAMIREGRLKAKNVDEGLRDKMRSGISSFGGVSGEDLRVDIEAVRQLTEEGKKYGVDVQAEFPALNPEYNGMKGSMRIGANAGNDEAAFARDFASASAKVEAAGKLLIGASKQMNQKPGGGPPPAAPGSAGAGVNPGRR
jgi:hypothetical protein